MIIPGAAVGTLGVTIPGAAVGTLGVTTGLIDPAPFNPSVSILFADRRHRPSVPPQD